MADFISELISDIKIIERSFVKEETTGNATGFVNAVTVWLNKPHVVNRRLCGSRIKCFEILNSQEGLDLNSRLTSLGLSLCHNIQELQISESNVQLHLEETNCNVDEITGLHKLKPGEIACIVREMLPKQPERHRNIPELIIFVKSENSFSFHPLKYVGENDQYIEVAYKFVFSEDGNSSIQLSTSSTDLTCDSQRKLSQTWIQSQLLKKLARWSEEPNLKTSLTSLKLISLEDYSRLYSELKNKYGLHFAKVWPEKTDPQKYVFEDVAIATYLLLLWKQDREKKVLVQKQSFVDLGCGNGLLVHILASEGHPGYGIDLRRRNIWDLYGPETILKEATITPSSDSLFPDVDWLIGNHSDELTPWIPVMAARSSYDCCYFVLPCCHYDFNCKFRHESKGRGGPADDGQYRTYLNFVQTVGQTCGFLVEEDMLRIPSTKRICFVGRSRTYKLREESGVDIKRQEYISSRCGQTYSVHGSNADRTALDTADKLSSSVEPSHWVKDFTPRDKVEGTRNCVSIRPETKETVIQTVFKTILDADSGDCLKGHDGQVWRQGGSIPICDAVKLFDKDLLQKLKSECGGLQTLLRNSSHIFQGQVQRACRLHQQTPQS